MSLGVYLAGLALLAVVTGAPALAARSVTRRFLPDLTGPPAWLATAVMSIALLSALAQLLGAVGQLRAGWLTVGAIVVSAAIAWLSRPPGATALRSGPPATGPSGRAALLGAALAALLVGAEWLKRSLEPLGRGMADPDSLWYHLPFAARFAQDGWITRLHFAESEPITTFHPANAELLHGIGMALLDGHDLLSPFINLAFAALCLLAGWCVGRPRGAAPAAMAGVAVPLLVPIMVQTQPGEAANDVAALAFFLAAAGLLCSAARPAGPVLAVAGLAAGLAVATKLSLLAPVGALTVGVLVAGPRGTRGRRAMTWSVPLAVAGGFWYLRNLARVGNPLPWLDLGPLPSPPSPLTDRASFSVAHYAFDVRVWRERLLADLDALGAVWPLLLLFALAGAVLALRHAGHPRLLGAVTLAAFAAYLVTPATAGGLEGEPSLFGLNLRFLTPALALGLALLGPSLSPAGAPARWTAPTLLALGLATFWDGSRSEGWWAVGLALAAVGAIGVAWLRRGGGTLTRRRHAAATAAALALAVAGWPLQRSYAEHRYDKVGPTLPAPSVWAQGVRDSRIGVVGYLLQYPLYGPDLSNHVQYVGVRGAHGAFGPAGSCEQWRRLLAAGRYRYVVTAPIASVALEPPQRLAEPREAAWTASIPGARRSIRVAAARLSVFELPRGVRASGCADVVD